MWEINKQGMRKGRAKKREYRPDPQYQDTQVTRFVNALMLQGKKQLAYTIFYDAMRAIEDRGEGKGIEIWRQALSTAMPTVEVRSRRVGGATFQVPTEVRPNRRISLAMKWLVRAARKRNEHTMSARLASELIDAAKGEGITVKRKDDTHRMAEANKAFSHFRF